MIETRDMRRRKRPRDPEALLICTRCLKIKTAAQFSYDNVKGRYFCYCKKCKSILFAHYDERMAKEDPTYLEARRARLRRVSKARTAERRTDYRAVQNRMSYQVRYLRSRKWTLNDIAAALGLCRQTVSKLARNEAGYRLKYSYVESVGPALQKLYDKESRKSS